MSPEMVRNYFFSTKIISSFVKKKKKKKKRKRKVPSILPGLVGKWLLNELVVLSISISLDGLVFR